MPSTSSTDPANCSVQAGRSSVLNPSYEGPEAAGDGDVGATNRRPPDDFSFRQLSFQQLLMRSQDEDVLYTSMDNAGALGQPTVRPRRGESVLYAAIPDQGTDNEYSVDYANQSGRGS